MAKLYEGNVSIWRNTKNKIVVKADPEGQFNADSVEALAKTMTEQGTLKKAEVNFFIPEPSADVKARLLTNKWGGPYVAFLPESTKGTQSKGEKLA
tara:strand:- start:1589 stop:1876 length:288 start_codon:yes stop_codon:yes gene_type:complete